MKKNLTLFFLIIITVLSVPFITHAETKKADKTEKTNENVYSKPTATNFDVDPLFGDNMIFQQNEQIRIWGTSDCEGEIITARFGESLGSSVVKDHKWEISFAERGYSNEPMVIELFGDGKYISFENIRIGEVWWVVGQSNVEFTMAADPEGEEFLNTITGDENITICSLDDNCFQTGEIRWRKLSRHSTYGSSALAAFIATELNESFNNEIPIAVMCMGYSGQALSAFLPHSEGLNSTLNGEIFERVLSRVIRMPAQGVVWYQGESDSNDYSRYSTRFVKFMDYIKTEMNLFGTFSVYAIELPPCFDDPDDPDRQYMNFGIVRGEIGSISYLMDDFFICPTSDLWAEPKYSNNLHPPIKRTVSKRLVRMMLAQEYQLGYQEVFLAPTLREYVAEGNKVTLTFSNVYPPLSCTSTSGFSLIGKDWKPLENFDIEVVGNQLIITADEEIYVIRYNCGTDYTFEKDIFLTDAALPAPAFVVTIKEPAPQENATEAADGDTTSYSKTKLLTAVMILILIVAAAFVIKKLSAKRR